MVNINGSISLNVVVYSGYLKVIKLLLDKGIDVFVINVNGSTSLNVVVISEYLKEVKLLLDKGADINA